MAIWTISVGVPSAFYCGNADDVMPLKKILSQRTSGIKITDNLPRTYVPSKNATVQSGLHKVTLQVSFLAEDDTVWKMSRGISLYGNINDTPGNQKYSIFLLYPSKKFKKSFWFPELSIDNPLDTNYNKDRPTIITLNLSGINRDPSYELIDRDVYTNFTENYMYPSFQERNPFSV